MVLLRRRGERTRRCRGNCEIGTKIGVKGGDGRSEGDDSDSNCLGDGGWKRYFRF